MNTLFEGRKFSRGHQRIADYITKHIEDIPLMVEEDLAQACQVSTSTVSRFWAEIGSRNLKDFKQKVRGEQLSSSARKLQSAFDKLGEGQGAGASVLETAEYLRQTADHLEEGDFEEAAETLGSAASVHLYGPGSADCLAALMDFRLTRFGVSVRRISRGGHELLENLLHVGEKDVIVIFGFVAESPEIAALLDYAKECGCRTLLITDLAVSGMLEKADHVLYTARGQLWEFHSMVAPIALIETLIVAVGKRRERQAFANGEELNRLRQKYRKWLPKQV
ncbi:MurR/RpiR family transcriptional regulator [Paenibacillus sp. HN-1]|uniref:MurR/RpiR family transcriptional regulator n=1 Tax=Paenibacillus TaxID=44249 RepID=UPI001CA82250|nr:MULTISPECIES: MurR/RpiR family transcriptional regulator [Paenibacillus]MBY9080252.1 MurR/RpiR family transcriptional regulator [Paenibacillus sp. CGMCC 1.18879]MBY9083089.1 MurR/RpiR family transcriptional regulator [Paenibacillus sinensis]